MNVNLSLLTVQPLIELVSFTIAVVVLKLEKQEMFLSLSVDLSTNSGFGYLNPLTVTSILDSSVLPTLW